MASGCAAGFAAAFGNGTDILRPAQAGLQIPAVGGGPTAPERSAADTVRAIGAACLCHKYSGGPDP